jgi:hypothetical protein
LAQATLNLEQPVDGQATNLVRRTAWPEALVKQDNRTLFCLFQKTRDPQKGRACTNKKTASVSPAAFVGHEDRSKTHPAFSTAVANRAFLTRYLTSKENSIRFNAISAVTLSKIILPARNSSSTIQYKEITNQSQGL